MATATEKWIGCLLIVMLVIAGSIAIASQLPVDSSQVQEWGYTSQQTGHAAAMTVLTNVVQIDGDAYHSLALRSDGSAFGWGHSDASQTNVPAGTFMRIACGWNHNIFLTTASNVIEDGGPYWASGGDDPATLLAAWVLLRPAATSNNNVIDVAAGDDHSCALTVDGKVYCWGGRAQVTNQSGLITNVTQLDSTWYSGVALHDDGTMSAWGENKIGTFKDAHENAVPSYATNIVGFACGIHHIIAWRADGTCIAWGYNSDGQCDIPASATNVVGAAGGEKFSMVLRADGTTVAWGDNTFGQTDVPSSLTSASMLGGGFFQALAIEGAPPSVVPTNLPSYTVPHAIRAYSTVTSSNITLHWPYYAQRLGVKIDRRVYTNSPSAWFAWTNVLTTTTDPEQAGTYTDSNVVSDLTYEYSLQFHTSSNFTGAAEYEIIGSQYLSASLGAPLEDDRGNLILLVESGVASSLTSELTTLTNDLVADGYHLFRHDFPASDVDDATWATNVAAVKAAITNDYNTDTSARWSIYIVGHIPVPYSGDYSSGFHVDNKGANPADWYYAVMNESLWTDSSVDDSTSDFSQNWNTPGDGKFDQSAVPGIPNAAIGRIDLKYMPAFSETEVQLLSQYLTKAHDWRHGSVTVANQAGLLLTNKYPSSPSHDAFDSVNRHSAFFKSYAATLVEPWFPTLTNSANSVLFAACGSSGGFTYNDSIGDTTNFVDGFYAVFSSSYGSYYGNWDYTNAFMKAPLAAAGYTVSSYHRENKEVPDSMDMGQPIGQMYREIAANYPISATTKSYVIQADVYLGTSTNLRYTITGTNLFNYSSLLGDPTMVARPVIPPTDPIVSIDGSDHVISWTDSADSGIVGYHVYDAPTTNLNDWTRLTSDPITTSYTNTGVAGTALTYWVRAVKEFTTQDYTAASVGAMVTSASAHTNYFVAKTGSDSNDGSSGSPFLTVQKGINVAQAGDTIYIGSGTYAENVTSLNAGTADEPITIDGQGVATVQRFLSSDAYLTFQNITFKGGSGYLMYLAQGANHTTLSNCTFDANLDSGIFNLVQWYNPVAGVNTPWGTNMPDDCLITGCTFKNGVAEANGIKMYGDRNTITNCMFRDFDAANFLAIWGRTNTVIGNTLSNLVDTGTYGGHGDFFQMFGSGADSPGIENVVIERNLVIDGAENSQLCMLEGHDSTNNLGMYFKNNLCWNISDKGTMAMPNVHWWNNTFFRCGTNSASAPFALNFSTEYDGVTYTNFTASSGANCDAYNNAFIECGDGNNDRGWYAWDYSLTNATVAADYNMVTENGFQAVVTNTAFESIGDPGGWDNFKWWEDNGINGGDPLVVDTNTVPNGFYIATNTSPLYQAGTNLYAAGVTTYYDGTARSSSGAFDIGAFPLTGGSGDVADPTITITSPADDPHDNGATGTATVSGTASDDTEVTSVTYSVDTGDFGSCSGTTSWSCSVTLDVGDNIVTVTAHDATGNTGTDTVTISRSASVSGQHHGISRGFGPTFFRP